MKPTYRRLIGAAACAALISLLPAGCGGKTAGDNVTVCEVTHSIF